ncbi:MAG: PepSY-associated TM helix domain-containing protein [Pyrinomonadaceae bacterium]
MKRFRKIIFWTHLVCGATAGVVILIMSVTGALLAFERDIIEFSERDVRYIAGSGDGVRLTPQEIIEHVRRQRPDAKPSAMSITRVPNAAWLFNLGREGQFFVDPFTGEITGEGKATVRGVMSELRSWHRYVALSGPERPIGKAITGASNLLFLLLAISGIYIWMPRNFKWGTIKPVIWFRRGLRGKGRNFNWHNTIGFWSSLFLIIFTMTATVISYQWASNLLFTLTGNEVPAAATSSSNNPPPQTEREFEYPQKIDSVWAVAEMQAPNWRSISLRLPLEDNLAVFTIDEGIYWNLFGRSSLTVDTTTSVVTKWEPYGEQNAARQLRSWFRFTHTGETGGLIGQFIGFVACVGGAFLVWTGFSLAFRRLANSWKRRSHGSLESEI